MTKFAVTEKHGLGELRFFNNLSSARGQPLKIGKLSLKSGDFMRFGGMLLRV